jgi:hypothetical protein
MFVHRRITLACAVAALAVAPGSAVAMPADNGPVPSSKSSPQPIVREVQVPAESDTTLALVFSGSALLIAAGAAALSGHDHRRIGKLA